MQYLTDTASPPSSDAKTEAAERWAGHLRFMAGKDAAADGWCAGMRTDPHDAGLGAARGIGIAILLALPVWGAVALAVRWLLGS